MFDIHSHILFGVDDGATSIEESSDMLAHAKSIGINTIIATPHYKKELHESEKIDQNFSLLKQAAQKFDINLLKGYEIKINNYPAQMPDNYEDLSLNGSRYILLELPFSSFPEYTLDLLYELQLKRFIPILAHPERCMELIKNKSILLEIVELGCLLQVDAASIIGVNGRKSKKFAKEIIKKGHTSFIASDAHDVEGYSEWYKKAYKKVIRWFGQKRAEELFSSKPDAYLMLHE